LPFDDKGSGLRRSGGSWSVQCIDEFEELKFGVMTTNIPLHGFAPDAAAIITQWQSALGKDRQAAKLTQEAYARDLRQFGNLLAEHLGEAATIVHLANLSLGDFRSFMAARRKDDIDSRSLARQLSAIRSFFRFAEVNGVFKNAAIAAVKGPKLARRLPRPLDVDAAQKIVEAGIDDVEVKPWIQARDVAVLTLLYGCGLRISEALGLTAQQLRRDPLVITGKGGKQRMVPVMAVAREAVQSYLAQLPFVVVDDQPVFRGAKGGVLSPRIVQLLVERLRPALGLPDTATPHALRHSFASHMLGSGADLRVIQDLLGHASLSSTQIYTDVNRTHLMAQYRKAFPGEK
jgi:integrase/recombinase XerC